MTEAQLLPVVWTLASMTLAVLAILFVSPAQLERLRATLGGRLPRAIAPPVVLHRRALCRLVDGQSSRRSIWA